VNNLLIILIIIPICIVVFFIVYAYGLPFPRYTITPDGLRVYGIYGIFIPKQDIVVSEIKVLNLQLNAEYMPAVRTNGIALPNHYEGWFILQNGDKSLVCVKDLSQVVVIPTTRGFLIMLSISSPGEEKEFLFR
jgi:Bacterial PH domain